MPIPETLEECKARALTTAKAASDEFLAKPRAGEWVENIHYEAYSRELFRQTEAMFGGIVGCIEGLSQDLLDLCGEVRREAGAPTTIDVVIRFIVRTSQDYYDDDPAETYANFVKALVRLIGVDKVRAVIDAFEKGAASNG